MLKMQWSVFFSFAMVWVLTEAQSDVPCMPLYTNDSVACVCNATYCDTVTRQVPAAGYYVTYTTSRSGLRFNKNQGYIQQYQGQDYRYSKVVELRPDIKYQTIEGFGGAVTDSAAINYKSLSEEAQEQLIKSYCSKDGLEYNMLRVPCGSTDFSTRYWAYNEYPVKDTQFTNFTLSEEDVLYRIPMIQACQKAATADIKVVSATWSPPRWMLAEEWPSHYNTLSDDYQQPMADYHCKYAELMRDQGINVWGMSISNEPMTALVGAPKQEFLSWRGDQMIKFLQNYFGPTIRNCSVQGIKVLAVDDQRYSLPFWLGAITSNGKDVMKYIDGIALHFYGDKLSAPGSVIRSMKEFPDKFVIGTEACTGAQPTYPPGPLLGSWSRAQDYIEDILEDLNVNYIGWLDWNMCLDKEGGPTWLKNNVDAPIVVDAENDQFFKQPMFYGLGHFTKFIPPGSTRIATLTKPTYDFVELELEKIEKEGQKFYDHVAFLTPQGTVVVVIHNDGPSKTVLLKLGGKQISTILEAESITTVEISLDSTAETAV